ncbi:MAG: TonB-dependent receptor, partial [Aliifodinibius sp.]|nr:TonB-dependent receptor [Fodinibius sp.]
MLFLLGPLNANPSEVGRIVGKLIDSETEEPLIGANVTVAGLPIGASTDVDGVYIINNVPEGEHKLIIQYIGYKETTITDVSVSFGQSTKMEAIELEPETIQGEEVVVEARFIKNTEAALLSKRLESEAITDGLSAEAISRTGAGEAAEAMTQVTGASVMD